MATTILTASNSRQYAFALKVLYSLYGIVPTEITTEMEEKLQELCEEDEDD